MKKILLFLLIPTLCYAGSGSLLQRDGVEVSLDQTSAPSLDVGAAGTWDDTDIREMGSVIYDADEANSDRRYKAIYSGVDAAYTGTNVYLGMAFSSEAQGGLTWTKYGKQALVFEGTSSGDKVECGSDSTIDDIFSGGGTVHVEIDADGLGESNNGKILGKDNVWYLQIDAGPDIEFYHTFDGTDGIWEMDNNITLDVDTGITLTYDSSSTSNNPTLYINGTLQAMTETSTPTGSADSDAATNLHIGSQTSATRAFDGHIKNVKLFNETKTSAELAALWHGSTDTDGLVANYEMFETTGSLVDSTANSNDCTVTSVSREFYTQPILRWASEDGWLIKDSGTYYLYYEAKKTTPFRHIDLATSTDGVNFEEHASNPVLDYNDAAWEDQDVSSPVVIKDGSTWYMYYEGRGAGQSGQIGRATSSDGVTWTKDGSNPIIDKGTGGTWDDAAVVSDWIGLKDGVYYLFYHGQDGANWKSGVATSTSLAGSWTKYANNPVTTEGMDIMGFIDPPTGKEYVFTTTYDTTDVNLYDFTRESSEIKGGSSSGSLQ